MKSRVLPLFLPLLLVMSACADEQNDLSPLPEATPSSAVAGVVRDTEGEPLAEVVVTLQPIQAGRTASVGALLEVRDLALLRVAPQGLRSTVTSREGRFAFADVAIGEYVLESSTQNHLGASIPLSKAAAETTFVDIDLVPTGTFSGTVLRENATTHQGSIVYVESTSYLAVTGTDGSYEITGVPVGLRTARGEYWGYLEDLTTGEVTTAGETVALDPLFLRLRSNVPPLASFAISPGLYFQNVPITFTPSATDDDGEVVLYEWDFDNDGVFDVSNTDGAPVEHVYPSSQEFAVKLRVTDDLGDIGLSAQKITIEDNQLPTVVLDAPAVAIIGSLVTYTAAASDPENDIAGFAWDTDGDGIYETVTTYGDSLQIEYTTHSVETVGVMVTDGGGLTATDIKQVIVQEDAVYVSTQGNPGNAGTFNAPKSSIQDAILTAQGTGVPQVNVALGTYSGTISLLPGIDLSGGRDPNADWSETTTPSVALAPSASNVHQVNNISVPTEVRRMRFEASAQVLQNSIGLFIQNANEQLEFVECEFVSRNGQNGANGSPGNAGTNGGAGAPGTAGSCDAGNGFGGNGGGSIVCAGGPGGRGGLENGPYNGLNGSSGGCAGGVGGSGGSGGDPGQPGGNGNAGVAGASGSGGASGSSTGALSGANWIPNASFSGLSGTNGRGGGGGGGGGAQNDTFVNNGGGNGGGGGGGAGSSGTGGSGGQGGWGSFSVYLVNASPVFTDCEFTSGRGGNGGIGGGGGSGGAGGSGGTGSAACTAEIGRGGNGGAGGSGGAGGGGGGGAGGPTVCVYRVGSSNPILNGASYVQDVQASGGSGGPAPNAGATGAPGIRTPVFP